MAQTANPMPRPSKDMPPAMVQNQLANEIWQRACDEYRRFGDLLEAAKVAGPNPSDIMGAMDATVGAFNTWGSLITEAQFLMAAAREGH